MQVRRRKPSFDPSSSSKPETESEDAKSSDDESIASNIVTNPYYVKMSLQLYQVDYKSFLLDFKSVPNVSNPQVSQQPSTEKRNSITNTTTNGSAKNDTSSDNLVDGGDKENVQDAVNGCDLNENGKLLIPYPKGI